MTAVKSFVDRDGLPHYVGLSTDTKPTASTLPNGATFFELDLRRLFVVGESAWWLRRNYAETDRPSNYQGDKSATTTVTGQSEAWPSGGTALEITNLAASNFMQIGQGDSLAAAEAQAASGQIIFAGTTHKIGRLTGASHWAWLGDTGTVAFRATVLG